MWKKPLFTCAIRYNEGEQIAQSKAEDNNDHLDVGLVKEEQRLKYKQQV